MNARAVAVAVGLAAFAGASWALSRSARNGQVEGVNWDSLPYDFIDAGEVAVSAFVPETPADVPRDVAADNERAFLSMLRDAEGTSRAADPYRVVFGYGHTLVNLSDHPYFTGEWQGAYFGDPPQLTTAAGAYQFLRATWAELRDRLSLPDFGADSQDRAALELVRQRGALEDVRAGRLLVAVDKVRRVWASLPGANYRGQGMRSPEFVQAAYLAAGGIVA